MRTIWTTVSCTDPITEEDCSARCRVTLGSRRPSSLYPGCSSRWVPADVAAEVEVHAVVSETTGIAREDLVELLQADAEFCALVAAAAEDEHRAARCVAAEAYGDARREDRRLSL
jgi:hypothetical protein